jgi:hypothetical protein
VLSQQPLARLNDVADERENMTKTGQRRLAGLGMIVISALILFGIHSGKMPTRGHPWLLIAIAVVFFLAGVKLTTGVTGRVSDVMAGIVFALMSSMGCYIAIRNLPLGGGNPFLSRTWNQTLGRTLFGVGALLTASAGLWFFHRGFRRKSPNQTSDATSEPAPSADSSAHQG